MRTLGLVVVVVAACGTNLTPQPAPIATLPDCTPNNDGVITADELPIAIGATVNYFTGASRAVSLAGSGSDVQWDLTGHTDDPVAPLGPVALDEQWYASQFPSSQFVVAASTGSNGLDGVFHQDDQALWLDGTASHDEAPPAGKTLIVYAEPVAVLRFPLADGSTFSTTTALPAATVDGLPFIGTDTFDIDVTASGQLQVPDVDFEPVLRVRTHLTRTPSTGSPIVSTRQTDLMFECFGQVAHAESAVDEPDADFTTAAVLRRFALGDDQ